MKSPLGVLCASVVKRFIQRLPNPASPQSEDSLSDNSPRGHGRGLWLFLLRLLGFFFVTVVSFGHNEFLFKVAGELRCFDELYNSRLSLDERVEPSTRRERGARVFTGPGLLHEILVAAHIRCHLTRVDVQHLRREVPDEMHVVRDEHQRALVSLQRESE